MALRNLTVRPRLIDVKAGHLMDNKPERRGLYGEIFSGHARVIEGMTIRRTILEIQFRHGQQQYRCAMRPFLIAVDQTIEQPIVFSLVLFRGN
jgi:hypothetical protein